MDYPLSVGIIIKDPLVSQDIAGIFGFWQPGSACRIFDTVADARSVAQPAFDPDLVFVAASGGVLHLQAADFDWLQARCVITLDLRDPVPFDLWRHLSRPFTQSQVIQAAHELLDAGTGERVQAG